MTALMHITINRLIDGNERETTFEWEFNNESEVSKLIHVIEDLVDGIKLTPEEFSVHALRSLPAEGLNMSDAKHHDLAAAVVYLVLFHATRRSRFSTVHQAADLLEAKLTCRGVTAFRSRRSSTAVLPFIDL